MPSETKTFNLRLWFAIGSFGMIALICVFSAVWVSDFLTTNLLERESEVSQEFMESIVTVDGSDMFADDGVEPYVPKASLLDFANHIVSMPGMLRVNIHASTHRILWSSEKQLVGSKFEENDELADAFKGRRTTEIGSLPDDSKPEHVALGQSGHFIEAYIPIRSQKGKGPVVGVVEFYKLPAALQSTIDDGARLVWIGATLAAICLFLSLYSIVQRGALLIERQQQSLAHMEAFAAIGQMSSAVAHSLRNPMSAIRSSAELWRAELPPERQDVAGEIIAEVDRMDGYVRDLLSYARSEPYHLQPVDPASVLAIILEKGQRAIARNAIEIESIDKRPAGERVMADPMLLEQALTSVFTNALEAMPQGGKLQLAIGPGRTSQMLRIEIADSGRGIPPELMKRVARSYFTTKARGLGLGLVLAKAIIERFQGSLDIASSKDVGTRVAIELKSA